MYSRLNVLKTDLMDEQESIALIYRLAIVVEGPKTQQ